MCRSTVSPARPAVNPRPRRAGASVNLEPIGTRWEATGTRREATGTRWEATGTCSEATGTRFLGLPER